MTVTAFVLALTIGLAMGILGGGGSIVAVPALTTVLHLSPKDAVATSLVLVGATAAIGAAGAWWRGVLPISAATIVGGASMIGAMAGGVVGARLPDHVQLTILAVVMFAAALSLWFQPRLRAGEVSAGPATLIALGLGVGALTGLVGVGGGFFLVPAFSLVARLPMVQAAAASLFVITLSVIAALPPYAGSAVFDWRFIAPFAVTSGAAAIAGGFVARALPQRVLQKSFPTILVLLGSYVLSQA